MCMGRANGGLGLRAWVRRSASAQGGVKPVGFPALRLVEAWEGICSCLSHHGVLGHGCRIGAVGEGRASQEGLPVTLPCTGGQGFGAGRAGRVYRGYGLGRWVCWLAVGGIASWHIGSIVGPSPCGAVAVLWVVPVNHWRTFFLLVLLTAR